MEWPKCEEPGCINGQTEHRMGGWQECPACNGTGERELTVDEAANVIWDCGWRITQVFKTVNGRRWVAVEEIYGYGVHFSEDGDTLKEAFNAAARAAYRRQG
jgi:hypothetical protein